MDTLKNRLDAIDQLVPDDIIEQLNRINHQINGIFRTLPELNRLQKLVTQIPSIETNEYNPELILANYHKYKKLIQNVIEIQSIDINKLDLKQIDITSIMKNKMTLTKLTQRYLENLFKSLILLERYIQLMNEQNEFFLKTNQDLLHLQLVIAEYERTHY